MPDNLEVKAQELTETWINGNLSDVMVHLKAMTPMEAAWLGARIFEITGFDRSFLRLIRLEADNE